MTDKSHKTVCGERFKQTGVIVPKTTAFLLPLTCTHGNKPDSACDNRRVAGRLDLTRLAPV